VLHEEDEETPMKQIPLAGRAGLLAVSMALLALGVQGCDNSGTASGAGGSSTTGGGGGDKKYVLGCTIPTFDHPFFVAMKKGLDEEAQAAGAEINVVDGKNDAPTQISAIDTMVVKNVNAIILCPTETTTLVPGVEKANQAKIPVITVNRIVDGGETVTYVGADDKEGGKLQGEALIEARPKGAKIVLLQGIIGSSPQRDREAGLLEAIKGKPEYEIVQRSPYDFDRTKAVGVVDTVLLQFKKGEIDAIVAQSDDGAIIAAQKCKAAGRDEIAIIGFNGESDAYKLIEDGGIYATILQDAETQGREAVKATLKHLKGEKVENPQITPLYIITKKNIGDHKPAWESTKS
jgi:ribose transport system substrate-binding protein